MVWAADFVLAAASGALKRIWQTELTGREQQQLDELATESAAMTHRRSDAACQRRHQRALERGYLVPKDTGTTHVAVPTELSSAVKSITASLLGHASRDSLNQQARQTTQAARAASLIGSETAARAQSQA